MATSRVWRFAQEMEARHDAVLMMYGEKAEQAEELKLDLEDVKAMYRQQVAWEH